MNPLSAIADKEALGRLLDAVDSRLAANPPEDLVTIENVDVAWPNILYCLRKAVACGDAQCCCGMVEQFASNGLPFMLFTHQLGVLRNLVIRMALDEHDVAGARQAMTLFDDVQEAFTAIYLDAFLNDLDARNRARLTHIHLLSDRNILHYFESHLEWMINLVDAVRARNADALPERDSKRCQFGIWLENDGARLINDAERSKKMVDMHETLHRMVAELASIMNHPRASEPIYALLKKTETCSLDLGNEISLLNNVIIMSVYNKDPLTGFLNRRFLDRVLLNQMEIAKATEAPFSIIMFDLDRLKEVNDTYGHRIGDCAIEHLADIVRRALRQSDLIFRFGGDEFLLIAPSTTLPQAHALADKLRRSINANPLPHEPPLSLTASFGIVEVSPHTYETVGARLVHELIEACDANLYAAKRLGRDRIV